MRNSTRSNIWHVEPNANDFLGLFLKWVWTRNLWCGRVPSLRDFLFSGRCGDRVKVLVAPKKVLRVRYGFSKNSMNNTVALYTLPRLAPPSDGRNQNIFRRANKSPVCAFMEGRKKSTQRRSTNCPSRLQKNMS